LEKQENTSRRNLMKSEISIKVTLVLNEQEAQLLMGLVQNSQSDYEDPQITELRRNIWNTLSAAGLKIL
jgi:hypothetical protein